jgi:predicted lipoprotein with Yx(FWY)xxD motif
MIYRLPAAGAVAVAVAVAVATGCGGGDNGTVGSGPATQTTTPTASTSGAKVEVRQTDLGRTLVDGAGRTLYLFEKDTGPRSTCYGACAAVWQPFTTTSRPAAGGGADAGKVDVTRRRDGARQVTYAGHPLYFYAPDRQPGDTKGEGLDQFGAEWYALSPAGSKLEESSGGSGSSSGGSGYGY